MHGVDEVEEAEARIFVEEQNHRVKNCNRQRNVAGPIVNPEIIKPVMRPGTVWTVTKGHEHSQQYVQRNGTDGHEAGIGREIKNGHAHWRQEPSIGFETAQGALTFHRMKSGASRSADGEFSESLCLGALYSLGQPCSLPDVGNHFFVDAAIGSNWNPEIDFPKRWNIMLEADGTNERQKEIVITISDF